MVGEKKKKVCYKESSQKQECGNVEMKQGIDPASLFPKVYQFCENLCKGVIQVIPQVHIITLTNIEDHTGMLVKESLFYSVSQEEILLTIQLSRKLLFFPVGIEIDM